MIVEVLQGIYKSPLLSSWVECVNPFGRINRTQGFVVHPIGAYPRCRTGLQGGALVYGESFLEYSNIHEAVSYTHLTLPTIYSV